MTSIFSNFGLPVTVFLTTGALAWAAPTMMRRPKTRPSERIHRAIAISFCLDEKRLRQLLKGYAKGPAISTQNCGTRSAHDAVDRRSVVDVEPFASGNIESEGIETEPVQDRGVQVGDGV